MRLRALRIALVVVGLAAVVYGVASLTGGWLGVPSHQPLVVSYGLDSPELERNNSLPQASVTRLGWPLLWYERTEKRFVDFDAYMTGGRPPTVPALYVRTTIAPRPGCEWISVGVVAVGLAMLAFAVWPRRSKPEATTP